MVLHDTRAGGVVVIGQREWALLGAADGSRDLDAIVALTAQRGGFPNTARLAELLAQLLDGLAQAGMLASGVGEGPAPSRPLSDGDRPVVLLPDFRLRCHGGGSCCRIYPTTSFSSLEQSRARAVAPEVLDIGHDSGRAFTPERGSELTPWHSCAAAMVDGRCAFSSATSGCVLHERGGRQAKPLGCRLYPVTLVDDGRELRASVAPECACVFDSIDADDGEALLEPTVKRAADLDPHFFVAELSPEIDFDGSGRRWSRDRYLSWLDSLERTAAGGALDVAALLWSAAGRLEADPSAAHDEPQTTQDAFAPAGERLAETVEALHGALSRRLQVDGWRAEDDLAGRVPRWMLGVLTQVDGREPPLRPRAEQLYLRALLHGRCLGPEAANVIATLRGRALRLLVARRMHAIEELGRDAVDDPALRWPLALVEAYCRGFGLV